jgi:RHS repeat-associated protein
VGKRETQAVSKDTLYVTEGLEVRNDNHMRYVFDGSRRIARIGVAQPYEQTQATTPLSRLVFVGDHLGSTSVVVQDNEDPGPSGSEVGCVVSSTSHLPYGGSEAESGAEGCGVAVERAYRFTGKEEEKGLGIYYFGARYHNPQLGRWMSVDVLYLFDNKIDEGAYVFCANSPINYVDQTGNDKWNAGLSGTLRQSTEEAMRGVTVAICNEIWRKKYTKRMQGHVLFKEPKPKPTPVQAENERICRAVLKGEKPVMNRRGEVMTRRQLARNQRADSLFRTSMLQKGGYTVARAAGHSHALSMELSVTGPAGVVAYTTLRTAGLSHDKAKKYAKIASVVVLVASTIYSARKGRAAKSAVSWKSRKYFGHTFTTHGAGKKNARNLLGRARGTGKAQGQWLDNQKAADYLSSMKLDKPTIVPIPKGLGHVIKPDGTKVSAGFARVVPGKNGVRTAFPILKE